MGARDRPGMSVTRSPSLGGVKGGLRQHVDTVFVIPALKLSQHLGRDLSFKRFRSGDERVLRDLQNFEIKMEASRRSGTLTNVASISSRIVINAASWHMAVISAPEHPLVCTNQFKERKFGKRRFRFCEREGEVNVQGRQVHQDREQVRPPCCACGCGECPCDQRDLAVLRIKCDRAFRGA